jgi:methylated-DNA-[protein]-cysteine S-methyltransferase
MTVFSDRIYALLLSVPKGKVTTYKFLASATGSRAYRAVGQVLRNNPYAPHVPCHRVVSSNGTVGGFMGSRTGSAIRKKIKLLRSEGVEIKGDMLPDFDSIVVKNFPINANPG